MKSKRQFRRVVFHDSEEDWSSDEEPPPKRNKSNFPLS